jgi:hypothetical protein
VCMEPCRAPCTPSTHPTPSPAPRRRCSLPFRPCALLRTACCAAAGVAAASTPALSAKATGTASQVSRWWVWSGKSAWANRRAPERQANPARLERAGSTRGWGCCVSVGPAGQTQVTGSGELGCKVQGRCALGGVGQRHLMMQVRGLCALQVCWQCMECCQLYMAVWRCTCCCAMQHATCNMPLPLPLPMDAAANCHCHWLPLPTIKP